MDILNTDVNKPLSALVSDNAPVDQSKGTYPFALNTVNHEDSLSNERGNTPCADISPNFIILGKRYTNDGRNIILSSNLTESVSEIGIIDKNCTYKAIVTFDLGFKLNHQIQVTYRLRRGCEDVIYFTDGYNNVSYFNFSKPEDFYTQPYKDFLANGSAGIFSGPKWDKLKFNLFPAYTVPCISGMEVLTGGQLKSGTYNFSIQYLDDNLNPTNFIYSSQLVPIYANSTTGNYNEIVGSSNSDVDELAGSPVTNKAIKIYLSGLDTHYKLYKVAITEATGKTGEPTRTLLSPAIPISRSEFTYDGNIQGYTEMPTAQLAVAKSDIQIAEHIEQIENKLILSNVKGKQVEYCSFQKFASKINSNYVIREAAGADTNSVGNPKSPNTMWEEEGYMGGEVYPYAIVYVFEDGLETPAFHIPGRTANKYKNLITGAVVTVDDTSIIQTWTPDVAFINPSAASYNTASADKKARKFQVYDTAVRYSSNEINESFGAMAYHENRDIFYEPKADCSENDYWGLDACGVSLVGKPIRHHRFPSRTLEPHVRSGNIFTGSTGLYFDVSLIEGQDFPEGVVGITINYEVSGVPASKTFDITEDDIPVGKRLVQEVNASFDAVVVISATGAVVDQSTVFTYKIYKDVTNAQSVDTTIIRNFGIQFSGIEYPHPDIVGHYFVRGNRDNQNRTVLDKGFAGRLRAKQMDQETYTTFSYFNAEHNTPTDDNYLFTPRVSYNKESLVGDYLTVEGEFNNTDIFVGSNEEDGAGSKFKEINNVIEYRVQNYSGLNTSKGNHNFAVSNSTILDATAKDLKYNGIQSPLYNLSWTNRLHVVSTRESLPLVGRNMLYVSYRVNRNVHPILDDIKYQRIHNCLLTRANTNIVFGGDIFISRWDIANSLYRKKKKGVIGDLLNIVLIAAAVVATVATAGAAGAALAPAISAVIAGATAAGIASAVAVTALIAGAIGVTATSIQTITTELQDGSLQQMTDDSEFDSATGTGVRLSSFIAYANELLTGMYVESEVNVALSQEEKHACGTTFRGQLGVYEYFRSKWLYFDADTNKWTPKGFACPEVYNYNKDYSRENEQSVYFSLPSSYDCCSDCKESHPNRTHYSEEAFQEELTDNYRIFKPNNYRDIEAEHGAITNIIKRNNNLFLQTSEALWILPQSQQERVSGEIVTFIGTGEFFSIPPKKLVDAEIGTAGTQHKWATINTSKGLLIVNELESKVYLYDRDFETISDYGVSDWFIDNMNDYLAKQFKLKTGVDFPNQNNPANPFGVGIHSTYDSFYKRILITKRDYLILPQYLTHFKIIASVNSILPAGLTMGDLVFDSTTRKFILVGTTTSQYTFIELNNTTYFESKSWTRSFSIDGKKKSWTSFHTYIPNFYIYTHEELYSFVSKSKSIWKHNIEGLYQSFYGSQAPHIIEQVLILDKITTVVNEDIALQTTAFKFDAQSGSMIEQRYVTFNKLVAYNQRQSTGELTIKPKSEFDDDNYMYNQVTDVPGVVLAERNEKDWNINDLKDWVADPTKALFLKNWEGIRTNYYIDKVVNQQNINYLKDWTEIEELRDKYLIVRLKFDNFTDVQLITNYILDSKGISFR